ncbi:MULTISPECIES: LysR family transcriptional regulator [Streptomyces]|uniref:LysR family transcriptional regulator n=1 Tax=Streptomyces lycopersici TaxID=2974589 RepID=UPI0021D0487D|nr:LysR family transcriptional regulator [Streptomyces sp. NEAU-383]
MKLSQLAAFVAIADTGSFTKAADSLGVTQSAVSHAIRSMESELRIGIMRRDRGGVDLTEAGHRIVEHARSVLRHTDQIRLLVDDLSARRGGRLVIGTSQTFSVHLLPRLMARFLASHQNFDVKVREGKDEEIAEMLRARTVDVGFVTLPKAGIRTIPLFQDELYAVLPVRHPLAARPRLSAPELAEEPLVVPADGLEPELRNLFRATQTRMDIAYRIGDLQAVLAMVAEGIGVAVLPSLVLPDTLPNICTVPLTPATRRSLAIAVRNTSEESSAVTAFVSVARAVARDAGIHGAHPRHR